MVGEKSTQEKKREPAEVKKPEVIWEPKTNLGKRIKNKEIKDPAELFDSGTKILETEIIEQLFPDLDSELLLIGQSKGKFGGGQRRVFKQTQKKTCEGNRPKFATFVVVGNKDGYIGLAHGKSRETVPAREKAIRQAKLNLFKIKRGCGNWQCNCGEPHTIPYEVNGKCGSVRVKLLPAPRGTGLVAHKEIQKILKLAGITDIWSKTLGKKNTTINLIKATEHALRQLMLIKHEKNLNYVEGINKKSMKEIKEEFEEVKNE